jgi:hypothetical protein
MDQQQQQQQQHEQQLDDEQYLPSLAIFGRCCLFWAEQLEQQAPVLLLPVPEARVQLGEQGGAHGEYSTAHVCIPGYQQGAAAAAPMPCELERLLATVSSWVGAVTTTDASEEPQPQADSGNEGASEGDSDSVRENLYVWHLEALSAAQQEVRRQGLSDGTLAALVQQLRATGVMLSRIAVPHFCNNLNCGNISGPTDVWLVSGRNCICGGCRVARYCGRGCQAQAWPQHQHMCKAMAARNVQE